MIYSPVLEINLTFPQNCKILYVVLFSHMMTSAKYMPLYGFVFGTYLLNPRFSNSTEQCENFYQVFTLQRCVFRLDSRQHLTKLNGTFIYIYLSLQWFCLKIQSCVQLPYLHDYHIILLGIFWYSLKFWYKFLN